MRDIVFACPSGLARELCGAKIIHEQKPAPVEVFLEVGGVAWAQVDVSRLGKISKRETEQFGAVDVNDLKRSRTCFDRRHFSENRGEGLVAVRVVVIDR